jgi:hypothetical protein
MKTTQNSIPLTLSIVLWLTACSANLQKVNLNPLLIQPGDLPPEYTVNTAQDLSCKGLERLAGLPLPLKGSQQDFEREGKVYVGNQKGYVRVFLFRTADDLAQVYTSMEGKIQKSAAEPPESVKEAWKFTIQAETSVGEAGLMEIATYPFAHSIGNSRVEEYGQATLLFRRCRAIAKVSFRRTHQQPEAEMTGSQRASGISSELASKDLLTYAKRLDSRLKKNICP